jgi:hypothetical protein
MIATITSADIPKRNFRLISKQFVHYCHHINFYATERILIAPRPEWGERLVARTSFFMRHF